MKIKMFTVYDIKAKSYLPPFYMQSTGQAMRTFEDTVNDPDHAFGKHPEDYVIFEVGTFDDQSCTFELHKSPITLAKAIELINQPDLSTSTLEMVK